MKRSICFLSIVFLSSGMSLADSWEIHGSAYKHIPAASIWDDGWGAQAELLYWWNTELGTSLEVGLLQMDMENTAWTTTATADNGTLGGDVSFVPVGLSMLYRYEFIRDMAIILGAGAYYLFGDDSVSGTGAVDPSPSIEFDPAISSRVKAIWDWELKRNFFLRFTAGYQFNLVESDLKVNGEKVLDTDIEGWVLGLGLTLRQ